MIRIRITLLFCLIAAAGIAQDARKELRAASEAFGKYENLSMEVSVYSYASAQVNSGSLIGKGKMSKSKDGYYSRFLNDELISGSNCTVILNHETKTMHCFDGNEQKKKRNQFIPQIDSVPAGDSLEYKGMVSGMKLVVIHHRNSYVAKTEVYINPATSLISKIVYYYPPANEDFTADAYKTEVIYDKISFDQPDKSLFDTEKYVTRKSKTWVSTPSFKTYRLTVVTPPEQ